MSIIDLATPGPATPMAGPANRLVAVVIYDGLGAFEFGITTEVFGLPRPELEPNWYSFVVCSGETGPLRMVGGARVVADADLTLLSTAGTVIVPGWRRPTELPPEPLLQALRTAHNAGARLVSICSGAFVLAAAGVLAGKKATTHWRHTAALASSYPTIEIVPDVLYVDEDDVLTSAGSAAGIDLCLHIVRKDFGAAVANHVARRLVVPPHREGGQAQFIDQPVPTVREGARLGPLLDRMRERIAEPQPMEQLAAEVGMSMRTFQRRFQAATGMTPGEWLLTARLSQARALLETTQIGIDDIALACGFGSVATLRHHFRERLGASPISYRRRFRGSIS